MGDLHDYTLVYHGASCHAYLWYQKNKCLIKSERYLELYCLSQKQITKFATSCYYSRVWLING